MNRLAEEKYSDKVDLIYSYNQRTPLFVRKAGFELKKKNIDEAIDILSKGLKSFSGYAAPYFLLGKALALKGNYSEAIEQIKKGSDIISSKRTYDYYLDEIENIKNRKSIKFTEPEELAEEEELPDKEKKEKEEIKFLPKDEEIEQLVKEISPEKTPTEKKPQKLSGKNIIVSETLAKIYVSQGEYKEALEIYGLLKEKHPDKVDYYSKRIEELKDKLDN